MLNDYYVYFFVATYLNHLEFTGLDKNNQILNRSHDEKLVRTFSVIWDLLITNHFRL